MRADEWRKLAEQLVRTLPQPEVTEAATTGLAGERARPAAEGTGAEAQPASLRTLEDLVSRTRTGYTADIGPDLTRAVRAGGSASPSALPGALRTAAQFTGVGPLVSGLLKVLRRGASEPETAELPRFAAPPPANMEAGLGTDRSFAQIDHALHGLPRRRHAEHSLPPANIQIQVQAMDSQSFLDHSDDIARAVRHAMLQSSGLNDVVTEL